MFRCQAANARGVCLPQAIRECECRPFRIVSNEDENGRVFNASFFDDEDKMRRWVDWLTENALTPGSKYHEHMMEATAGVSGDELPSSGQNLLFGRGVDEIADTRFGECMRRSARTRWRVLA